MKHRVEQEGDFQGCGISAVLWTTPRECCGEVGNRTAVGDDKQEASERRRTALVVLCRVEVRTILAVCVP